MEKYIFLDVMIDVSPLIIESFEYFSYEVEVEFISNSSLYNILKNSL